MVDSPRQPVVDRPGNGEPADAGVEDADGPGAHRMRNGMLMVPATPPARPGSADLREIGEMGGDVGLEAGEEMVEDQEDDPILVLPPLVLGALGAGSPEIGELMPGLETHAQRDAFPGDEYTAGQLAVEPRLPPAREEKRAPERPHRTDGSHQGVGPGLADLDERPSPGHEAPMRGPTGGIRQSRSGARRGTVSAGWPLAGRNGSTRMAGACGNRTHRSRRRRLRRGFEDRPDHQARSAPSCRPNCG